MTNYRHVQFISWEIYTGPNRGDQPWGPPPNQDGISYTGLGKENAIDNRLDVAGQIQDIEARLAFTYRAVETASKFVDKNPDTLKVFMAPEFLYRGKGGAYIHDLINGWDGQVPAPFAGIKPPKTLRREIPGSDQYDHTYDNYPGLFGYLQRFATVPRVYEHWLFVFGTAISASFPESNEGSVLDSTKKGEIYNSALIQRGWWGGIPSDAAYASRKHYIANNPPYTDFIKSQYSAKGFTLDDVTPADRVDLEPNENDREGSATFTINGINDEFGQPIMFGLEVCLDHAKSQARSTPKQGQPNTSSQLWGRIRTAGNWVKIQLVPSGGMFLHPESIRLADNTMRDLNLSVPGYAFNCDGLTTLPPYDPWGTINEWKWGAHTQIWNANSPDGTNPPPRTNQLVNASYGQPFIDTSIAKVDDNVLVGPVGNTTSIAVESTRTISASSLWDFGSGYVRVMKKMPL